MVNSGSVFIFSFLFYKKNILLEIRWKDFYKVKKVVKDLIFKYKKDKVGSIFYLLDWRGKI